MYICCCRWWCRAKFAKRTCVWVAHTHEKHTKYPGNYARPLYIYIGHAILVTFFFAFISLLPLGLFSFFFLLKISIIYIERALSHSQFNFFVLIICSFSLKVCVNMVISARRPFNLLWFFFAVAAVAAYDLAVARCVLLFCVFCKINLCACDVYTSLVWMDLYFVRTNERTNGREYIAVFWSLIPY